MQLLTTFTSTKQLDIKYSEQRFTVQATNRNVIVQRRAAPKDQRNIQSDAANGDDIKNSKRQTTSGTVRKWS